MSGSPAREIDARDPAGLFPGAPRRTGRSPGRSSPAQAFPWPLPHESRRATIRLKTSFSGRLSFASRQK